MVEHKGRHVQALESLKYQIWEGKAELKESTLRMAWMKREHTRTRAAMNELEDRINLYSSWIDWVKKGERVKPIIDHIDEDKTNNNASNLCWVTPADNNRKQKKYAKNNTGNTINVNPTRQPTCSID